MQKDKKFYVTTPIYYVNAEPHIGHTYTTVAADVLARHHRLLGDRVFFSTGTDEHGAKIESKAREAGEKPRAFADDVAAKFELAWHDLNISNDRFIRTTENKHIRAVQNALLYMKQKGDIYLGKYEGLYCRGCEQFKNEKDLLDGKCPDHQTVPEKLSEESYMFRMSKYASALLKKIESDEFRIRPIERKNEIVSFYKNEGLNDVSFSRENVKWGIPLPWRPSHTAYVWSDAFLNYLTVLDWDGQGDKTPPPYEGGGRGEVGEVQFWPPDVQLMSKDILRVHATIWPAMLLSLDLPLQKEMFVHGFFLIDSQKMSKSLGNVIAPRDLTDKYGVDATRYLLMGATPFGHDGDIGYDKFDAKYNADLANGLGNLAARTITMTEKLKHGKGMLVKGSDIIDFVKFRTAFNTDMQEIAIDRALERIWAALRQLDKHISDNEPWKKLKTDIQSAGETLYTALESLRILSFYLTPFMPETAAKILSQLGFDPEKELARGLEAAVKWGQLDIKAEVKKGEVLFPRIQ